MRKLYGDMHIHIGSAGGKAVKITASRRLDLNSIIYRDAPRKGLEMVGVVDAGSPPVVAEIEQMIAEGRLYELERGGFLARNDVLFIPACEVESREGVHLIIYLPGMAALKKYQRFMGSRVRNPVLSTQKAKVSVAEIINLAVVLEGVFCPAHAFTPHKGVYGQWTPRLADTLGQETDTIVALELGLSADSDMADMIEEVRNFTFMSNSDAHSPENVGREYNLFRMRGKDFSNFKSCMENSDDCRVLANYGMDPRLGKYHRSYCPRCDLIAADPPPIMSCPACGSHKIVTGVMDRITAIRDNDQPCHPVGRPPYNYRVPLRDLPGMGPKTIESLLKYFGDEITICEEASYDDLSRIASPSAAAMINKMRLERLDIIAGGGGRYGKVKKDLGIY